MAEKPIIFSGSMVRAILDGRKRQTRRITIPANLAETDTLWVRETFCIVDDPAFSEPQIDYRADGENQRVMDRVREKAPDNPNARRWKPAIHMPRKYCRLLLRVTDVRQEWLQDISDSDVRAEGVSDAAIDKWRKWLHPSDCPGKAFSELWDSINAKRGYSWESNPQVWVISFEPQTGGISGK